jgi:ParB family transcriptional regulator, chromosome partitioning protein
MPAPVSGSPTAPWPTELAPAPATPSGTAVDLAGPTPVVVAPPEPAIAAGANPLDQMFGHGPGPGGEFGARYAEIPIGLIEPNPRQPRTNFDEVALDELVHSIREIGLLQPVVVRGIDDGRFELVAGERRLRAAQLAGLDAIPSIIRDTPDDAMLRNALLENLHRADLNPLEEAAAYDQLLRDFGCTQEELATRLGRSRPQISNTLRLMKLPPLVQRRVAAGVLSAGHARALLGLDDAAAQEALAHRIVAEGMSVRATEEAVAMGAPTPKARRVTATRTPTSQGVSAYETRLADRLETKVGIKVGKRRGTVTISFATIEDLDRIVGLIDGN